MDGSLRFCRFFVAWRHAFALAIAIATLALGSQIRHLEVFSQFSDLLPRDHPYIQTYEAYRGAYGTANVVVAAVVPKRGDIYQTPVFEAIDFLTLGMDSSVVPPEINARPSGDFATSSKPAGRIAQAFASGIARYVEDGPKETALTGVDHNLTSSVTHRTTRAPRVLLDGTLVAPQLVNEIPADEDGWRELRKRVRRNPSVFGVLVSADERAALIRASFIDSRIDYAALFKHLRSLEAAAEERFPVEVHLVGQPVLFGWIYALSSETLLISAVTVVSCALLLWLYFRRSYAVLLPLTGATVSVVWGLGFAGWRGIHLDPLVLVVPMLITARAISHSVQFVERFFEEYERLGDKEEACVKSMAELLLPGTLAILTDSLGLLTLGLAMIPLIHKLGLLCAFWSLSILPTEMLLNRLMILYLPPPRHRKRETPRVAGRILKRCAAIVSTRAGAVACVAGFGCVTLGSIPFAADVAVGEERPGTPILYGDSEFNVASAEIGARFFGLDELLLVVHSDTVRRLYAPDALKFVDSIQRVLETDPAAGGSISMLDVFKEANRRFHNNDPRWSINLQTTAEITGFLYLIENSVPAQGVLNRFRDYDGQSLAIRVFYSDHRSSTVSRMDQLMQRFAERETIEGGLSVKMRVPERPILSRWLGRLLPPPKPVLEVDVVDADGKGRRRLPVETGPGLPRGAISYWDERGLERTPRSAKGGLFGHRSVEDKLGRAAEIRPTGPFGSYQLWVRRHSDAGWEMRPNAVWLPEGVELRLAAGTMGVLAAANEEVAESHRVALIAVVVVTFVVIAASYQSLVVGGLLMLSLATAALVAMAVQGIAGIGLNVNTLPLQAIGIGIGVDYSIYIVDRVRREVGRGLGRGAAIRKAVETTGSAIGFTATTLLVGIAFWIPISSLRFSADMSLLLSVLMALNALASVLLLPALLRLMPERWASGRRASTDSPASSPADSVSPS